MKAIVLKPFYDAELKELYHENETIEISEEKFNEYVAAGHFLTTGGAGGSGGGGVSSWNDLTDKPFESKGMVEVMGDILPLQYFTLTDGSVDLPQELPIVANETYIVNYNGVEYECTCVGINDGEYNALLLGNLTVMGFEGGGDLLFTIAVVSGMNITTIIDLTSSVGIGIGIKGIFEKEDIEKLDSKYLESEWNATCKYGETLFAGFVKDSERVNQNLEVSVFKKYELIINGVSYDANAVVVNDGEYMALQTTITYDNPLIDFTVECHDGYFIYDDIHNEIVDCFLQIKEKDSYEKLPKKYLPDGIGGGVCYVDITIGADETLSSNKTFAELFEAYNNGQILMARMQDGETSVTILQLATVDSGNGYVQFDMYQGTVLVILTINADGVTMDIVQ